MLNIKHSKPSIPEEVMQREIQALVEQSLKKARKYRSEGNFGHAYAHYTAVVELSPGKRPEVEAEFTDVLCKWGMDLEKTDFDKTVLCYTRSLDMYPENPRMLNNFAAHYLRQDSPREALPYLARALATAPNFLPAEWNLDYAYNLLIDRWHFPMLNDRVRNTAYERAIAYRIGQGYTTVLDIGTGSGLLSLYAKHSGALETYACELSPEMSFIADRVFSKNDAADVQLLPMNSSAIEIPRDLPHRVKLIVTETFDAGVFGELALSTLIHAHEHLLEKKGMILPMRAKILAAAVQSSQIRFISFVSAFKSSDVTLEFLGLDIYSDNKNYDAITLKAETRVTDPVEILNVDFNNLKELKALHTEGVKSISTALCKTDGTIDGVVTWFQLQLDEDNVIDTSDENSCWQLAVFSDKPVACSAGQELTIVTELFKEKLHCGYEFRRRQNTSWRRCKAYFFVPQHVVMFLNDKDYVDAIARVAQQHKNGRYRFILDACPFPIYGLEMLKHNEEVLKVFCYAETEQLRELILHVAESSGLDTSRVSIVESLDEIDRSLDVIFNHNFSIQGEINDWSEPSLYRGMKMSLSGEGFMLPRRIFLIGQLVHSNDLPRMVFVDDRNVQRSLEKSSYVIGEFVNQYACKQRFDLDSTLYKYTEITDERVLVQIDEGNETKALANFGKIPKNGILPNVLVCWYTIHVDDGNCVASRRDNSFMNHSAIVLGREILEVIEKEEDVKFEVLQMNGLTRVTLIN